MNMRLPVVACLGFLSIALTTPAHSANAASPAVLVASGSGVESFGEIVILALPLQDGSHFGFVLNKPTEATVSDLFPDEAQSSNVSARVDVGGPAFSSALFALVVDADRDIEGLRRMTPRFSVALGVDEVDRVIAAQPGKTRYFLGLVAWNRGDLAQQVKAGAWRVLTPETGIVLSTEPATLWQRLSRGSVQHLAFAGTH